MKKTTITMITITRIIVKKRPLLALVASLAALLPLESAAQVETAPANEAKPAPELARQSLPIVEVVVYEDRALVTREGEVPVLGGGRIETVMIGGLPPALSETSLRAGLANTAEGRVVSIASEVERRREIQDVKLRAAEEERQGVARKIAQARDELTQIAAREAYLDAYEKLIQKAVSERTGGGDPEPARWEEALRFVRDGRGTALAARRAAERLEEDLGRSHADIEAEVERLRRPEERSERTAEVVLETTAAGRARLRLAYVIEGAGWSPRYDARFDPQNCELAVTYFGEIRQRTGEDWKQARLVLSTARPSIGASRPEMLPLRLAAAQAEEKTKGGKGKADEIEHRGVAARAEDAAAGLAGEAPGAPAAAGLIVAAARENATSATFTVPGTADIPADGRPHKVPVATFRERAESSFEAVPRFQRFVYLKCAARNGSPYPMLAGAVDIFRGSGFIGTSRLKFVAPGRAFEVSLGIEESLKVRRTVTADAWNDRGTENRQGFDIEVANFGEKPQTVTVIDNYPVADIEEVKVRLDASTTRSSDQNEKEGLVKWRLEVPPGEARVVHLEYAITYPKSQLGK